ncbi:MAG: hypothetical protein J7K73_00800 [Nanoarchaeota archaeon]|nr:hypothetical protein [Nanoarchaeota archaeon]
MEYSLSYWKKKLRKICEKDIVGLRSFRSHAWTRAISRNIGSTTVLYHLTHPENLEKVEKSKKYDNTVNLYFKLSNVRSLFVALMPKTIDGKEKFIVKTTYIINKKFQRRLGDKRWKK